MLGLGLLVDLLQVLVDLADPLAGVLLPVSVDLLGLSRQSSLVGDVVSSSLSALLVGLVSSFSDELGVGVEGIHGMLVLEGVLLLDLVGGLGGLLVPDGRLDFVRVDDSGEVRVGDLVVRDGPVAGGSLVSSVDAVELLESTLSPDDESSDVSSGGELEEVESGDVDGLDTGDVPEGSDQGHISAAIDNKRSSSGSVPSVSVFAVSSSDLDSVSNLLDITESSDVLKELDGLLGPLDGLGTVVDDEGEFGDLVNSVSSGLHQGEDGGSSNGGGDGELLLLDV